MNKHVTETEIQNYIEQGSQDSRIKGHLKECRQCFHTYVSLKEALFMMKRGEKASPREVSAVLSLVKEQNRSHVRIMFRFLKDRVMIASSGQETLDFQGFEAAFSYRGSMQGPISVTRTIGGREITIVLAPAGDDERFTVSLSLKKEEALEVSLLSEGRDLETIADLTKQKLFDASIPARGSCDLIFRKNGEEVCTVNLTLESEG